jgi:hypothetical protein
VSAEIRRALAGDPAAAEGWRRIAFARFAADPAAAAAAFARALFCEAFSPARPAARAAADWNNLAEARRAAAVPRAAPAARRALALAPDLPEAHNTWGNLLLQEHTDGSHGAATGAGGGPGVGPGAGAAAKAAAVFARALALRAGFSRAAYNLAAAAAENGETGRAIDLYRALLARQPDFIEARWNLALALLAAGRWREGWQAHESRRADPRLAPRIFAAAGGGAIPAWDGSAPAGRRILLAAEQGFGDTIQFLRYVPQVIALGARVILEVPPPLRALAATIPGLERLVATGEPVPAADLQAPLMSLPLLLGPEHPPPAPPYLAADPVRRAAWRRTLDRTLGQAGGDYAGSSSTRLPLIGIAWAGNPDQPNDRRRSIAETDLVPLAALGGLRFVSLQKGRTLPPACRAAGWHDAGPDLADFAETAALIAELDLVIAVDTAVAHLAGALGKPLWVLLSTAADWRWPRGRRRTPWYPGAHQIWRRPAEPWRDTLARLAGHLAALPFDPAGYPDGGGSEEEKSAEARSA